MRLHNVKSLHWDIPEGSGPLPEPAQRRLLLQGANGSGKSTILETILNLWKFWGEWIEEGNGTPFPMERLNHFLANANFAAIEVVGIPDTPPLWISLGRGSAWGCEALKKTHQKAIFANLAWVTERVGVVELPADDFLARRHRSLAGSESFPNIIYFQH